MWCIFKYPYECGGRINQKTFWSLEISSNRCAMVIQQLVDEVRTSLCFLIFYLVVSNTPLVGCSSFDINFSAQVFYVGRLVEVDEKDTQSLHDTTR